MALALTVLDRWSDGKRIHVIGRVVASGNYVATGDTLDLTRAAKTTKIPVAAILVGRNGVQYSYITGTTPANGKVKMMGIGGGSIAAGDLEHTHDLKITGGQGVGDALQVNATIVGKTGAGDVTAVGGAVGNIQTYTPAAPITIAGLAELAAAPYPAAVITDNIGFYGIFRKHI